MKIAFDVSVLDTPHPTGVERAALELLIAMRRSAPGGIEIHACSPRRVPPILEEHLPDIATHVLTRRSLSGLWRETSAPRFAREMGLALWHAPITAIPLRLSCPSIATIHELAWLEEDAAKDAGGGFVERWRVRRAVQHAARIVCPSRRTLDHLKRQHPEHKAHYALLTHGVSPRFFDPPAWSGERRSEIVGGPEPFFLVLGRTRAKKNVAAALEGFARFARGAGDKHRLLIAGPPGGADAALRARSLQLGLESRVRFAGWLAEEDLAPCLGAATGMLALSDSEGFGMNVLEANAAGTSVIAAPHGALREAADGVIRWVDPRDPEDVARALSDVAENGEEMAHARKRGWERARRHTWDATAELLLEIWSEAIAGA